MENEEHTKSLQDYIDALRRRKWQIAGIAAALFSLALTLAVVLPPVYESAATILIEQQEIPTDLVQSTVTSYAGQRIEMISQRVMTTANLVAIMDKYGLYAEERERQPTEVIVENMRNDILTEMISADVIDPRSGRPTKTTIAFTVGYGSENPGLAQQVANELTSLFLSENLKTRTEHAEETQVFLADEAQKLSQELEELELKLADFKDQHAGELPELQELNLQIREHTGRELLETDRRIANAEQRKIYLEAQLTQIEPMGTLYAETGERIMTPKDRLKVLETQYLSLAASYSQDHPDLARMRKEIQALRREVGGDNDAVELSIRLSGLRAELAAASEKYSEAHPDVRRLRQAVDNLEREVAERARTPARVEADVLVPENPAYIQVESQLEEAKTELASLLKRQADLRNKLEEVEGRLLKTPQVEREYRSLLRDYENTQVKYQEIRAKEMTASVAEQLETERKGERFTLIEPPLLPAKPARPNRFAILFLGAMFSVVGGLGTALGAEALDKRIRGARRVTELTGVAPLASLPYLETDQERRSKRLRIAAGAAAATVGVAVMLTLVHSLYKPLDVLWFVALRRFGI